MSASKYVNRKADSSKKLPRQITFPQVIVRKQWPYRQATFPRAYAKQQESAQGADLYTQQGVSEQLQDNMSGRSSPMDNMSEDESVADDVEEDGNQLQTPSTADILTEEPFQQYRYRMEDFGPQELDWIEKIKMFKSQDVGDGNNSATPSGDGVDRQLSMMALNQTANYDDLTTTDAFGKLYFKGEDDKPVRSLPSWFIRAAVNMPAKVVQELLEELEVMDNKSRPLRIHCIDYSQWPKDNDDTVPHTLQRKTIEDVVFKLQKDLRSMCDKTAGVVLTWSGLGGDNLMHKALAKMAEDPQHLFPSNLATIATPPWLAVDPEVKEKLTVKGAAVHLKGKSEELLGEQLSPHASHFILLDEEVELEDILQTDSQKREFRHFHYKMIEAMEAFESQKEGKDMPVVCVLINGHHDALKMVVFALEKKIPVLVVEGSGGYADIIADVYMNAVVQSTKERDGTGQVRTKNAKTAGEKGNSYLSRAKASHQHLLRKIFNSLDYLTIYVPALSVQSLDSVFFEALLKHNQQDKFSGLVEIMQQSQKIFQHTVSSTETGSLLDSEELQMDFFIEALKQNSVDIVKVFLNKMKISTKFMQQFHMGRVLRLYTEDISKEERLIDFRKQLRQLLKKLPLFPLRCVVENCPNCDVPGASTQSEESELAVQRTCLHPIQELFLWSLHAKRVEMAVVFWERCDDKIAAALVAQKVFRSLAKQFRDPDVKWQMEENVRRFQSLAVQTLKNCHDMDEIQTELLLAKPCPWWGGVSVVQLAIMTGNREFMTQTACKDIMTRIWKGLPPSDPDVMPQNQRPCQLVDTKPKENCCEDCCRCSKCCFSCSPRCKYLVNFVVQVGFLMLFSYGLLSDLGRGITPVFYALIVWVAAVTLEELRQLLSTDPVICSNNATDKKDVRWFYRQCWTYWRQNWNRIDVATILLFWCGMLVFVPVDWLHVAGRVLLSIDIFFFFIRTFQMLMVFDELGLMLVMIYKMVQDTFNFMIILLIFVLAYAVASESLLYPESDITWDRLYNLPRKAYWQIFGELILEEIELRGNDSCTSDNNSKHYGYDEPHCPTNYGSYIVPFMLGIHVMITNVLLLNLLIARFGKTFDKVHDEARVYQSWHRCEIITEYYSRKTYPPPINILFGFFSCIWSVLTGIGHCCQRCCRAVCSKRQRGQAARQGDDIRLDAVGGKDGNEGAGGENEQGDPLLDGAVVPVTGHLSADRRSMDVFWDNRLPAHKCLISTRVELYTVELMIHSSLVQTPSTPVEYQVARKPFQNNYKLKQALTVWDLDPSCEYHIRVERVPAKVEPAAWPRFPDDILDILKFEERETKWVRKQEDAENPILEHLKDRTESVKSEVVKVINEMKEKNEAIKNNVNKLDEDVTALAKNLKKELKKSKGNKESFTKIQNNLERLNQFFEDAVKSANEKVTGLTDRVLKAEEKKKNAEREKESARKESEKEQKERMKAEQEKEEALKELQKARELQATDKAEPEKTLAQIRKLTQALEEQKEQQQQLKEQQQQQMQNFLQQQQQQLQTIQEQLQQHYQQQLQAAQEQQQQQIQTILSQISLVAEAVRPSTAGGDDASGH